jgi:hypothetical protein
MGETIAGRGSAVGRPDNLKKLLGNLHCVAYHSGHPSAVLRGERDAIMAKQMAHRGNPVVFHHINFTASPLGF